MTKKTVVTLIASFLVFYACWRASLPPGPPEYPSDNGRALLEAMKNPSLWEAGRKCNWPYVHRKGMSFYITASFMHADIGTSPDYDDLNREYTWYDRKLINQELPNLLTRARAGFLKEVVGKK